MLRAENSRLNVPTQPQTLQLQNRFQEVLDGLWFSGASGVLCGGLLCQMASFLSGPDLLSVPGCCCDCHSPQTSAEPLRGSCLSSQCQQSLPPRCSSIKVRTCDHLTTRLMVRGPGSVTYQFIQAALSLFQHPQPSSQPSTSAIHEATYYVCF